MMSNEEVGKVYSIAKRVTWKFPQLQSEEVAQEALVDILNARHRGKELLPTPAVRWARARLLRVGCSKDDKSFVRFEINGLDPSRCVTPDGECLEERDARRLKLIQFARKNLTLEQRRVFRCAFLEGMERKDVAEELQISRQRAKDIKDTIIRRLQKAALLPRGETLPSRGRSISKKTIITIDGVSKSIEDWSVESGVSTKTIKNRVRQGITGTDLIAEKLGRKA